MHILYEPLPWDSEKLKVVTGRITPHVTDQITLEDCLTQARQQQIQLLYWPIADTQPALIALAQKYAGILVDHKITYQRALDNLSLPIYPTNISLACYYTLPPEPALLDLAYASGKYSRFRQDPHLTELQFQTLYHAWMTNSIKREIADSVLVLYQQQQLIGMASVGEKNHRADIGLLAVAPQARGQGIGKQLVHSCCQWFKEKNYSHAQVITQAQNIAACRLYESCGFTAEKIEHYYHLWLSF